MKILSQGDCFQGNCLAVIRSGGIFNLHRKTIIDSFSCTFLIRQFHLNFCMHYFLSIFL